MRPPTRTTRSIHRTSSPAQPRKHCPIRPSSTLLDLSTPRLVTAVPDPPVSDDLASASAPAAATSVPVKHDKALASTRTRNRHRMTEKNLQMLEAAFARSTHPSREEKASLSVELDTDLKTITIWFQNKRQTMKKLQDNSLQRNNAAEAMDILASASALMVPLNRPSPKSACTVSSRQAEPPVSFELLALHADLETTSAPAAFLSSFSALPIHLSAPQTQSRPISTLPRKPLAIIPYHHPNMPVPEQPLPLAPAFDAHSGFSKPACTPSSRSTSVLPHDLWKHIPSSPLALRSLSSPDAGTDAEMEVDSTKRPRTLEWACARHAKRRRENPELDSEEDTPCTPPPPSRRMTAQLHTSHVRIPSEYFSIFPPDVLQGAVLLLALKEPPRKHQ
ncbi:hypothetical protein BV25DRAFT_1986935 [Artomyces pyxidatus]|uniref:Uncharacterized protein n=1 Tax=Artomyces pyxidatus TaxID=48021 RepID=A0ACB8TI86_9AGAM|nr:hypothetical protein BV25DRAFT_1986935 [Artomyces pyxidatus]